MRNKIIKGVSLFTGAGGMDVGFENAGITVVLANEIVREAAETYKVNRKDAVILNDNIYNVMDKFEAYSGADIVFGGPPCQGFSVAGKMNPEDERSKFIFTFLDVVEIVKPRAFVMENVKALAKLEKWADVRNSYMKRVNELGYNCVAVVLNATDYGVPQKRERVFFIGIRDNDDVFLEHNITELICSQRVKAPTVRDVLKPLGVAGTERNPNTCPARITFATNPIMRKSPYAGMYFNGQGRPINVDDYANTLPASMGGNKTPFVDEAYLYGNETEDWVVS